MKKLYPSRYSMLLLAFLAWHFATASKLDSLIDVLGQETTSLVKARAHIALASLYSDTAPDVALEHGMLAYGFCSEKGNDTLTHEALQTMGYAFYTMGDYENLLKYSLEALKLADAMSDPSMICTDHAWISSANLELGYTSTGLEHSKKALQIALASRDSLLIAYATLDLEAPYRVLGNHEKSMEYCRKAYDLFVEMNDEEGKAFALQQIGRSHIDQEKYADALPFSTKALRTMEKDFEGTLSLMWSLQDMAAIHCGTNELDKAEAYLERAEKIAIELNADHDHAGILESRSTIAEKREEWQKALDHYKQYTKLSDSIFNKNIARQMAGLQIVYEANEREKENELLRVQNELQRATISDQKWSNTMLISGAALLFILCLSFLFLFRTKKKANKKLREKNQLIQEQSNEIGIKNMELQRQNSLLAEAMVSNDEKKLLLKEIHHRVKNNLQIINSLLKMQSLHITDARSLKMFEESQGRIVSMALVHEQLYNSVDLSNVAINEYIEKLVKRSVGIYGMGVDIHLDLKSSVKAFPIDTLIPLGLLLNEMLTNTLKYAFGNRGFGTIAIELDEVGNNVFRLMFSDDGKGMNEKDFQQGGSFGFDLIHTLVGQLDGEIRLDTTKGTTFCITFRQEEKLLKAAS